MSVALQELESFTNFVQQRLNGDESNLSLEDCVRLWRQQTERDATLDDIQQGQADLAAGLAQPLSEAFDDVCRADDWLAIRASLRATEQGETGRPFDEFAAELLLDEVCEAFQFLNRDRHYCSPKLGPHSTANSCTVTWR